MLTGPPPKFHGTRDILGCGADTPRYALTLGLGWPRVTPWLRWCLHKRVRNRRGRLFRTASRSAVLISPKRGRARSACSDTPDAPPINWGPGGRRSRLDGRAENHKLFTWTKTADEILERLNLCFNEFLAQDRLAIR
jgi:hypothetical protein